MNLNIEDLLPYCKKCNGSKTMEDPELKHKSFGSRFIGITEVKCDECCGKGVIPTEAGKVLIEFINRAKDSRLIK